MSWPRFLQADFTLLREPNYRRYWYSRTTASLGGALAQFIPALAVLTLGGSVTDVGLVLSAGVITRIILLPVGGVWSDRLSRKLVIVATDSVNAVLYVMVGVTILLGRGSVLELAGAAIVSGVALSFSDPALTRLLPEVVQPKDLQKANALLGLSSGLMKMGGPAVAGVAIAFAGSGPAFLIAGAAFTVSAISLFGLAQIQNLAPRLRRHFWHELTEGWREVSVRPWYWGTVIGHAFSNGGMAITMTLGPYVALHKLGGASAWGFIAAVMAVGLLVGSFVALRWKSQLPLVTSNRSQASLGLLALALAVPSPIALVFLAAIFAMAGIGMSSAIWTAAVQEWVPGNLIARVSSVDVIMSLLLIPFGFLLAGPLSQRIGFTTTLILASLLLIIPGLVLSFIPSFRSPKHKVIDSALVVVDATKG